MPALVRSRLARIPAIAAALLVSATAMAAPPTGGPAGVADAPSSGQEVAPRQGSELLDAPAPAVPPPASTEDAARMERARFSGKRMVVEILAGAAVGSLAAYATYKSLCDGEDCLGAGLAGAGMNFAITPLAVWGVGRWMGGQGSLGWTYLGASAALAPFSAPGPVDETPADTLQRVNIELAVSTLLLPVTSAAFFELSSHVRYARWRAAARAGDVTFGIAPSYGRRGVDGAMGNLALRF
ncbi:MAG: hypothetical protein K8W52_11310 [Deltaproteobacteria bacterium]|nr:hypothetical protein [Deltaproteobacteria bacterium]